MIEGYTSRPPVTASGSLRIDQTAGCQLLQSSSFRFCFTSNHYRLVDRPTDPVNVECIENM